MNESLTADSTASEESGIPRYVTSVIGDRMPDLKGIERVQRFRKSRRERGDRETNIWIAKAVSDEIDDLVGRGRFRTRQDAIAEALEAAFVRKELKTIM